MMHSEHQKFYNHLKAGGKVWRNDPLNKVMEVLHKDHPQLKDDLRNIRFFGFKDLMVIEENYEHLFPLYHGE